MVKKSFFILIILSMILLSACGAKDAGGVTVNQKPVDLVVYYPFPADWSESDFMNTFGNPIHEKFPNVTIKYIAGGGIDKLIAAGQQVDIVFTSIAQTPAQLLTPGLQYDISPLIQKYHLDLNRFEPSLIDMQRQLANGEIYGLPVYVPPSTIYYNKDIFDKFGVPYPKDGMTWDDLYELDKQLTRVDGGTQYYGIGSSYGHLALLNQLSIPQVDPATKKATFDTDPRWITWVQNLVRLYQLPAYQSLNAKQMSEPYERDRFFKDRNIAMFIAMTAIQGKQDMTGLNFDFASFPTMKERPGFGPQAYPSNFYVTSMCNEKDMAFQVIAYLTSDEFQLKQTRAGHLLTVLQDQKIRQSFGLDDPFYKGKNTKAMLPDKYAAAGSINPYNNLASLNSSIEQIILGQKDLNTALRDAADTANQKIQTALQTGN